MAKHKKRKHVSASEERDVFDLFKARKGVPAIVRRTGISKSKIYERRSKWGRNTAADREQAAQKARELNELKKQTAETVARLDDLQDQALRRRLYDPILNTLSLVGFCVRK